MISGASTYRPSAHGPTPFPPKASQSLAPTGCTPSASAVSASDQPRATTRWGSSATSTWPNAVWTVTGKAPPEPEELLGAAASPEDPVSPEPQLVTTTVVASRTAPRRNGRTGMSSPLSRAGSPNYASVEPLPPGPRRDRCWSRCNAAATLLFCRTSGVRSGERPDRAGVFGPDVRACGSRTGHRPQ